ncbi:recQ-mediated genome instability protein 1-like [Arctopsyche grandis]|uniref:recQ-mediated genome instability protein 1-like n=1 Tax=Arctopsyche grandis TaxID=121162 RepID=UPI00406D78D9
MQFISEAKSRLKTEGMEVTEDWLKDCVEYFCDQMKDKQIDIEELSRLVKSQWLLADLQDISPGCLPPNLKTQVKTTIQGTHALQMNSLIDIGAPSYQQLQKLSKVDTTNVVATDTNNSEPSSQRMFKLILTDGVQEISGIEYKPLRNFNTNLLPGTKIQIKGPVDCRRGVLMLEEKHVTILGGEVDDLLDQNNYKNILIRKVGQSSGSEVLPSTEFTREVVSMNTINATTSFTPTVTVIVKPKMRAENDATTLNASGQDLHLDAEMFDDNFDLDELDAIENQVLEQESKNTNVVPPRVSPVTCTPIEESPNDPFDDDELVALETSFSELKQAVEPSSNAVSVIYPVKVDRDPFVYLKQLESVSASDKSSKTFIVKGQILKVVGKLSFQKKDWVLKCTLVDGSASLDVNFANDLLSVIIGYTPEEMITIKKKISSEPNLKESVMEKLNRAMDHIQKLDCLFHILYKQDVPYVVETSSLNQHHFNQLKQRALNVTQPS